MVADPVAGVHAIWMLGRTAGFDVMRYTAFYDDLINVFGTITAAATQHFAAAGFIITALCLMTFGLARANVLSKAIGNRVATNAKSSSAMSAGRWAALPTPTMTGVRPAASSMKLRGEDDGAAHAIVFPGKTGCWMPS